MTNKERAIEIMQIHKSHEVVYQAENGQCFFDHDQCLAYNKATGGKTVKKWTRDELEKTSVKEPEPEPVKEPEPEPAKEPEPEPVTEPEPEPVKENKSKSSKKK